MKNTNNYELYSAILFRNGFDTGHPGNLVEHKVVQYIFLLSNNYLALSWATERGWIFICLKA